VRNKVLLSEYSKNNKGNAKRACKNRAKIFDKNGNMRIPRPGTRKRSQATSSSKLGMEPDCLRVYEFDIASIN